MRKNTNLDEKKTHKYFTNINTNTEWDAKLETTFFREFEFKTEILMETKHKYLFG